jgi:hypothetical protein
MTTPTTTLANLAQVIRSKNSGPFEITFDVIFDELDVYERIKDSGALQRDKLAKLYHVDPDDIVTFMFFDTARAFKLTIKRPWRQGSIGEKDTFGAQQHVPLMNLRI